MLGYPSLLCWRKKLNWYDPGTATMRSWRSSQAALLIEVHETNYPTASLAFSMICLMAQWL